MVYLSREAWGKKKEKIDKNSKLKKRNKIKQKLLFLVSKKQIKTKTTTETNKTNKKDPKEVRSSFP